MFCCYDVYWSAFLERLKFFMKKCKKLYKNYIILPVLCLLLASCADVVAPEWLTGEPNPKSLKNYKVKARKTSKTWPDLANISEVKPKFSNKIQREIKAKELKSDMLKADADKTKLLNIDLYGDLSESKEENDTPFSFSALRP